MPIAPDKYYLSIEPSLSRNREYFVPTTTVQALREMRRALPSWFLNALGRSHGNAECSVVVTEGDGMDIDFFTIAQDWFWIHWNLQDATSRLRKELAGHNLTDRFIIEQAFRAGLCSLVKSDPEQRALEIMMKYGKP